MDKEAITDPNRITKNVTWESIPPEILHINGVISHENIENILYVLNMGDRAKTRGKKEPFKKIWIRRRNI